MDRIEGKGKRVGKGGGRETNERDGSDDDDAGWVIRTVGREAWPQCGSNKSSGEQVVSRTVEDCMDRAGPKPDPRAS